MKDRRKLLLPLFVFIITIISGLFLIYITETSKQQKITPNAKAQAPNSGAVCKTEEVDVKQPCDGNAARNLPGGVFVTCKQKWTWRQDPVGCGLDCYVTDREPIGAPCFCGMTPTPTPEVTNTPTPTATGVPNTPTPTMTGVPPTNTPTPSATGVPPTNTPIPTATLTPVPNACGYTQCDTQHPCNGGLICVTAKNDKSYCAKPEYQDACKNNPSTDTCCKAPPAVCGFTQCDYDHPCGTGLICTTAKNDKSYCAKPANEQACKNNPNETTCCSGPTTVPTEIIIAKGGPTNTPPAPTIPTVGTPIHWIIIAAPILLVTLGLLF